MENKIKVIAYLKWVWVSFAEFIDFTMIGPGYENAFKIF